jgi:hypothetical protein
MAALQQAGCARKLLGTANRLARVARRHSLAILVLMVANGSLLGAIPAHAQATCVNVTNVPPNSLVGDGVTDNTTKFNALIAQLTNPVAGHSPQPGPNGWCISFPAGKYLFASAPTAITYPAEIYSVSIVGAGSDNTTLYFPNSNGITIDSQDYDYQVIEGILTARNVQSIHVRDLSFTTGQAGSYTALTLYKPCLLATYGLSDVVGTTFRGDDGAAVTDYWAVGVNVEGLSNINFDGDLFYGNTISNTGKGNGGTGISLTGSPNPSSCPQPPSSSNALAAIRNAGVHVIHAAANSTANMAVTGGQRSGAPSCATTSPAALLGLADKSSRLLSAANRSSNPRIASAVASAAASCTCSGGAGSSPYGVVYNIGKSGFYNLNDGLTVGTLIQGVVVRQSNFANGVTGIYVPPSSTGVTEVTVSGSTFSDSGTQVLAQSPVASIIMNGNIINVSGTSVPNAPYAGVFFDPIATTGNPCGGGGLMNSFVNNIFVGTAGTPTGAGISVNFPAGPDNCLSEFPNGVQGVIEDSGASGNVFNNLAVGVDLTDGYYWTVLTDAYDPSVATKVLDPYASVYHNSVGVITQ